MRGGAASAAHASRNITARPRARVPVNADFQAWDPVAVTEGEVPGSSVPDCRQRLGMDLHGFRSVPRDSSRFRFTPTTRRPSSTASITF